VPVPSGDATFRHATWRPLATGSSAPVAARQVGAKSTASAAVDAGHVAPPDPSASLVVRVRTGELAGRLVVTLADVCAGDRGGDRGDDHGDDDVRARATIDVQGASAEVVAVEVDPPDGALTARLLDGVADALRARGVERVRITAELDL
jgi:hypothetical protein